MAAETWIHFAAAAGLLGLMAYAVLGGADFGGGVWDLLATGPRRIEQRRAIASAMGPVWEANHVWLIFVIVLLFTCFPRGYAALATALFIPFHLALVGIMLRGASFVFRGFDARADRSVSPPQRAESNPATCEQPAPPRFGAPGWGVVFGVASTISPFVLGAAFGTVTAGDVRVDGHGAVALLGIPWLRPYPLGCGALALSTCAYLAAVYLVAETQGELREDFHRRAILAGTTTAVLAAVVPTLAYFEARWFFDQLVSERSLPIIVIGLFFFALSAWAVFRRHYHMSRVFVAGQVVLLLLGWGIAHQRFLIYPDLALVESAAPLPTLKFMLLTLPLGIALLAPSLWWLFRVFKARD